MTSITAAHDPAAIAAKIQKLLALAESSNEHEAALAAERASSMLTKYNLSLADLPDNAAADALATIGHDIHFTKSSSPWVRHLWQAVAKLNFCGYAYSLNAPSHLADQHPLQNRTFHWIIGTQANTQATVLMANYLTDTVFALGRAARKQNQETDRYMWSFWDGCARRTTRRLYDRYEANTAPATSTSTAQSSNLPAVYENNEAQVSDYMSGTLGTSKSVARRTKVSHARGYHDGTAAGDNVGIDTQLSSNSSTKGYLQ